jgi:hypothetical protein
MQESTLHRIPDGIPAKSRIGLSDQVVLSLTETRFFDYDPHADFSAVILMSPKAGSRESQAL